MQKEVLKAWFHRNFHDPAGTNVVAYSWPVGRTVTSDSDFPISSRATTLGGAL